MKRYRWTVVALGVLAGLIAYRQWIERPGDEKRPKVLNLNRDTITGVEIDGGGSRLVIKKDPAAVWMIQDPGPFPASVEEMTSFFGNVAQLEAESEVAEQVSEPSRFGLEPPQKKIIFFAGDVQIAVLKVGATTQVGSGLYVQKEGDPKLYLVSSYRLERYRPDPLLFRNRQVVSFDKGAVTVISVRADQARFDLSKGDGGTWQVRGGADGGEGDAGKVEAFLQDLKGLSVSEFVSDTVSNWKEFGLDKPQVEITVTEQDKTPLVLQLGNERKESGIYFRIVGQPSVYLIPTHTKDKVSKKASDFVAPPPPPAPKDPYAPQDPYGGLTPPA